jgi:hypothetical protein
MKATTAAVLIILLYCITICFCIYVTECGWWLLLLVILRVDVPDDDNEMIE